MLIFTCRGNKFQLPVFNSHSKTIELNDYVIDVNLVFDVPSKVVTKLWNNSCVIQTDENPIIVLELQFSDFTRGSPYSIKELEHLEFTEDMLDETILYFPGYAKRATMRLIKFYNADGNKIDIKFEGVCVDIHGELLFSVEVPQVAIGKL